MSNPESYYRRKAEERKAYQRDYYARMKSALRRQREVQEVLEPEKAEARRQYYRDYYAKNREALVQKRRDRYRKSRAG
jgi:hypothetical protein